MTDQPQTTAKQPEKGMALIKKVLTSANIMGRFASIMGEKESAYYINSVILTVANSSDLQECTVESIVYSALRAATLKLTCDPAIGEAWLVPFNNSQKGVKEAAFIPGYKGLKNLALRTGKYRYINTSPIYNGEQVVEDRITGALKMAGGRMDNQVVGWLAYFEMTSGFSKGLYMTCEEIHDHASTYSKTYGNKRSRWQTDSSGMERKTVLRLLLNRWADMGAGASAYLADEEIIDANFQIASDDLSPTTPSDASQQTEGEIMQDLGFKPPTAPTPPPMQSPTVSIDESASVPPPAAPQPLPADLVLMAQADPIQAFWTLQRRVGIPVDEAKVVIKNAHQDFVVAFSDLLSKVTLYPTT